MQDVLDAGAVLAKASGERGGWAAMFAIELLALVVNAKDHEAGAPQVRVGGRIRDLRPA